jgi:hypothetical protein
MNQQGNSSPSKTNFNTKDPNSSKGEEISNIEFQKIIVGVINELKEEVQKLAYDIKEDMRK